MIIPTGAIHDGEEAVREYFRVSRTAFPDQRNELIAVHHVPYARDLRLRRLGARLRARAYDLLTILAQLGLVPGGGDVMSTVRPASAA